jgi:Spy/CpxP family protein refolding chaperone
MKNWLLATALILTPALTFAQGAPTASHSGGTTLTPAEIVARQVARLTRLLDLTAAQQTSATSIFTTEINALTPLRTAEDTAQTALNTAIKANDAAGMQTLSTQLGVNDGQQTLIRARADASFYIILTADQKAKYDTLREDGGGRGKGHK